MIRVVSDTKKPIKIWATNLEVEAENQARNLAGLPFIANHVALMPDAHFGKGSTVGSVIATKGAIIPAAVGVDIGCFTGDTKIPLLNGLQKTLKELTELEKEFWVYSIDENQKIVPGKAKALLTRKNANLIEITVSGGEVIRCTPDHKFLLRNGQYLEAQYLKENDSLMPLYRKYETRDGYETVKHPGGGTSQTYKMVYKSLFGYIPEGHVVHHIDHKKYNNNPENLELMTIENHSSHHNAKTGADRFRDPIFIKNRSEKLRKVGYFHPDLLEKKKEIGILNITNYMQEQPEHFQNSVKGNGQRGKSFLINYNKSEKGRNKSKELSNRLYDCNICGLKIKSPIGLYNHKNKEHNNHKVLFIKYLNNTEDVYCLQVEKYHNFALSAGVFVHNCGMSAIKLPFNIEQLGGDEKLRELRHSIERSVPVGHNSNKIITDNVGEIFKSLGDISETSKVKLRSGVIEKSVLQIGTLGGGNHFIEICTDLEGGAWIMLHSGSRNIGKSLADIHITKAKDLMKQYFIDLPDPDLAYLAQQTPEFSEYLKDLMWAQSYAKENRNEMVQRVLRQISYHMHKEDVGPQALIELRVDCHHNYTAIENHFGQNMYITRKGAVSAKEGELGIIPGSMGAKSFIVQGLGNKDSFNSCSHGAGRKMSRTKARELFTIKDLEEQTNGVECRKDDGVVDEIPAAYKDIDEVMNNQSDLVKPLYQLKQVICIKG